MAQYNTHNSNQWDALLSAISGGSSGQPISFDSTQWNQLTQAILNGGGGGGGSAMFTALDTDIRSTLNTSFNLTDNISNYDIIIFEMYASSQTFTNQFVGQSILIANSLIADTVIWIDGGMNDRYIQLQIIDDTHYKILQTSTGSMINGVYGIKF